jgi:hypothetical protein
MWGAAEWQNPQNERKWGCESANTGLRCFPQYTISERRQRRVWHLVQDRSCRQGWWVTPTFVLMLRIGLRKYEPDNIMSL